MKNGKEKMVEIVVHKQPIERALWNWFANHFEEGKFVQNNHKFVAIIVLSQSTVFYIKIMIQSTIA